ncbi:MAG: aldehyde dehydrogenase family protein [Acidobacteriota bacterium]
MMKESLQNELKSFNPATGEFLGSVSISSDEDVDRAFKSAEIAFESWRKYFIEERIGLMKKVGRIIFDERDEIAELITAETGKPLMESYSSDLIETLDAISYYCKNARKILKNEKIRLYQPFLWGKKAWIKYEPLGPVAVISPWNFPLSIPMATLVPVIIAGNTVLFKPSEYTPLIGKKIKEIFDRAGFPEGVLNILYGDGKVGQRIIRKPVKKVFFTGSSGAGEIIMKECAGSLKPVVFELGGKDPMIVLKDADLDIAVDGAIFGSLFNCGQTCCSVERIFVEEEITEEFFRKLEGKVKRLRVGNGMNEGKVDIGPIQNQAQFNKVKEHLEDAIEKGARVLAQTETKNEKELFFSPILISDINSSMRCWNEETFGPLIKLIPVKDWREGVKLANLTDYGLGASIWTKNISLAKEIAKELQAGVVWINNVLYSFNAMQCPWGGVKESGIGRVHGRFGLLEATNPKLICMERERKKGELWWYPYTKEKLEILKNGITFIFGKNIMEKIKLIPSIVKWFLFYR